MKDIFKNYLFAFSPEIISYICFYILGYNAARGDFDWESDNLAEMELNGIDVNGDDLYQYLDLDIEYCDSTTTDDLNLLAALTSTALQVYNQR